MSLREMLPILIICAVGSACSTVRDEEPALLPHALVLSNGTLLRIGAPVPEARPGQVLEYANLKLPDGASRAWVEVDGDGNAGSFELWYAPERRYTEVVQYHEARLGPPSRRYERPAGACAVWEDRTIQFEVCRSREPAEHGLLIAHVWPRQP